MQHIKTNNKITYSEFNNCVECCVFALTQSSLDEHIVNVHGMKNMSEPLAENEVVLVRAKMLMWPAEVMKREGYIIEIRMIHDNSHQDCNRGRSHGIPHGGEQRIK